MLTTHIFKSAFRVNLKYKIVAAFLTTFLTIILIVFLFKEHSDSKAKNIKFKNFPIENTLQEHERIVSVKICNSSKYVLDAVKSFVYVDLYVEDDFGRAVKIATKAKLIEIGRLRDAINNNDIYMLRLLLPIESAIKVLPYIDKDDLSVMINSSKNLQKEQQLDSEKDSQKLDILEIEGMV